MPRTLVLLIAVIAGCAPDRDALLADDAARARDLGPGVGPRELTAPIDPLRPLWRTAGGARRVTGGQEGEPISSAPPADGANDPDTETPPFEDTDDTSDTAAPAE